MKIRTTLFLLFISMIGFSQSTTVHPSELKQKILNSQEVADWQNAMIAFQKNNSKFCALKYEQHLNQRIVLACGKPFNTTQKDWHLKIFRSLRIIEELKEIVKAKELVMRQNHPEITTHFKGGEIFQDLYAPILKARRE